MDDNYRHGYVKRWWEDEDGTIFEDVVIVDLERAEHIAKLLQEAIAKKKEDNAT